MNLRLKDLCDYYIYETPLQSIELHKATTGELLSLIYLEDENLYDHLWIHIPSHYLDMQVNKFYIDTISNIFVIYLYTDRR